jgi:hypothetical protein
VLEEVPEQQRRRLRRCDGRVPGGTSVAPTFVKYPHSVAHKGFPVPAVIWVIENAVSMCASVTIVPPV